MRIATRIRRVSDVVIPESTEHIIAQSTFRFAGTFVYCSARAVRSPERHLLVTRDDKETTVVTSPDHLGDVDVLEINPDRWTLITVDCASPFYCVGFIAKISAVLSGAGFDILVVSTFSRDWVFVKESEVERAERALLAAGMTAA